MREGRRTVLEIRQEAKPTRIYDIFNLDDISLLEHGTKVTSEFGGETYDIQIECATLDSEKYRVLTLIRINAQQQLKAELAAAGGDAVGQVVGSMDAINESSSKVTEIIDLINNIAFQTNILALNAAVEAARADEYGRHASKCSAGGIGAQR